MANGLEISLERREAEAGQVALVRIEGEVDLSNAEQLADALSSAASGAANGSVVDLTAVPFMDSSGLRVLLMAVKDERSPLVAVVEPESPVARLIELAEVDERLPTFASEREALEAVPASGSDRDA
jgi:stage II sporulation protein AA (anti-sigma F factor antagonist)